MTFLLHKKVSVKYFEIIPIQPIKNAFKSFVLNITERIAVKII